MTSVVVMPRLSEDMASGRVQEWLKRPGDAVEEGEAILTVESEKATVDVAAPAAGVLLQVLAAVGDDVEVGVIVAVIGAAGEQVEEAAATATSGSWPEPRNAPPAPAAGEPDSPARETTSPPRRPVSPAARRKARETGIDLSTVVGSGPDGLITEADVPAHQADEARPDEADEATPFMGVRRRTAERMSASRREVADVTTFADVDMTEVVSVRARTGASFLAYTVAAVARTLREFPMLNASLAGDRILLHAATKIGVAVATDAGLVVPVIENAAAKSVIEISAEIERLGNRARSERFKIEELSGATFTVTNSGAYGSLFFTPIINLPQVAILGMGKVHDAAVVRNGVVVARRQMYLCLSYDHRVVDGKVAVEFLQAVRQRLELVESAPSSSDRS